MAANRVLASILPRDWAFLRPRIAFAATVGLLFGLPCLLDPPSPKVGHLPEREWSSPMVLGLAVGSGLLSASSFRRPFRSDPAAPWSGRTIWWMTLALGTCGVGIALTAALRGDLDSWRDSWRYAQYALAVVALGFLLRAFWNCFEVYWDLLWMCPVLSVEAALLLGMAMGVVLPGYGLTNLFWGDGPSIGGALLVPILSSFMIVLTLALLLLCGYFSITVMYDEALAAIGEESDPGGRGLDREGQVNRRVMALWRGILPGTRPDDPRREPGHFIWWCLRPALVLLALPAALPVLSVSPTPGPMSRGGWIIGLTTTGWVLRWLLVDRSLVRWVAAWTASDPRRPVVNYPMTINAKGLFLVAGPLLITLLTGHVCDLEIAARTWPGSLILDVSLVLICVGLVWRLKWPGAVRGQYLIVSGVVIASTMILSLSASKGLHWYIAAPFSICWLLMAVGVTFTIFSALVSGYIMVVVGGRRALGIRRFVQAAAVVLLLLWNNGRVAPSTGLPYPSLDDYDRWNEGYASGTGEGGAAGFGSPALRDTTDVVVLRRWRDGAPSAISDEPSRVGIWQKGEGGRASWVVDEEVKPNLVVVATSGGGLRAAVWAEKVLYEIERAIPEFPDRVRLITGSSGGMLGAACFVTGLTPWDPAKKEKVRTDPSWLGPGADEGKGASIDERVARDLDHDFLTAVVDRLVFGDVEMLGPADQENDRGRVLEDHFLLKSQPIKRLKLTFRELADLGEGQGRRPSMVITPTMVEDSRRLIISNLDLGPLTMNHGYFDTFTGEETYDKGDLGSDFPYYSTSGIQFFHLFPDLHAPDPCGEDAFNLAKAIRMNATFPYVTPAVAMRTHVPRRVVDAGYYDNYGIDLAVSWLEQHRRWLELNTSGVTLIQVRAFSNESHLKRLEREKPITGFARHQAEILDSIARGSQFLTTPLSGIGAARMNVNYYRNDAAIENLKRSFTFDMLERLAGVGLKDEWEREHAAAKAPHHAYTEGERAELTAAFPAALSFFRSFTFTCSDDSNPDQPRVDRGPAEDKLPAQETLSWYLADAEFSSILKNWNTFDNVRRFQYLRGAFRRYFEEDDEAVGGHVAGEQVGWHFKVPPPREDRLAPGCVTSTPAPRPPSSSPPREDRPAPSFVGLGYTLGDPAPGNSPFRWTFKQVPAGTYRVMVNLPAKQELPSKAGSSIETESRGVVDRLAPDDFAGVTRYSLGVLRCARFDSSMRVTFPQRIRLGALPDEFPEPLLPWQRLDSPRRGTLGLWYKLADWTTPEGPGDLDVVVELSNETGDGKIIADAVRLDRIE